MEKNRSKYTIAGTDIEEVKRLNANSGMSYNELNEWFAKQVKGNNEAEFGKEVSLNDLKPNESNLEK